MHQGRQILITLLAATTVFAAERRPAVEAFARAPDTRTALWTRAAHTAAIHGLALATPTAPLSALAPVGSTYDRARKLAYDGRRARALAIVETDPRLSTDADLQYLRGLILSWEGRYDEARSELQTVLLAHPDYVDARLALANVERWNKRPEVALRVLEEPVPGQGFEVGVEFARADLQYELRRYSESARTLDRLLEHQPKHPQARGLRKLAFRNGAKTEIETNARREIFSDGRDPWREYQVQLRRATSLGLASLTVSQARRVGIHSERAEFEMYPDLRDGTYMWVGVGVSPDGVLYPGYTAGAEVFQRVKRGLEVSAGFRRLGFQERPLTMYTGSGTHYVGDWSFAARGFFIPSFKEGNRALQLSARRELGLRASVGVRYGRGSSVEEIENVRDLALLRSSALMGSLRTSLTPRFDWKVEAGYTRQRLRDRPALDSFIVTSSLVLLF